MLLDYYLNLLDYNNIPDFLIPYLNVPSLNRLKNIGYFCGMDYASKSIYDFKEYITRYDHSLTVSLLTYKLTKDKKATLAALFHDIATPCFSHVIDYMNKDYENQESTEEYTEYIIKSDEKLLYLLNKDNIDVEDIINFKNYTIVDNNRPKLCADRLDGIILTAIGWTKNITKEDIYNILNNLTIYINEDNEKEIGITDYNIANKILDISTSIDIICHSNEDNYMMELLAKITKLAILKKYIKYENLYILNEKQLFEILKYTNDQEISNLLYIFKNINIKDIPIVKIDNVKKRNLNPLVNNKRLEKALVKHI